MLTLYRLYRFRRDIGMTRRNAWAYAWQNWQRGNAWTLLP